MFTPYKPMLNMLPPGGVIFAPWAALFEEKTLVEFDLVMIHIK